jgi:hypothetical protein
MAERRRRKEKKVDGDSEVMRLESTRTEVEGFQHSSFLNIRQEQGLYSDEHIGIQAAEQKPESPYLKLMRGYLLREPCRYNHPIYQCAGRIYEALRSDITKDPLDELLGDDEAQEDPFSLEFDDENEKRLTYTLVFQTLKC